MDAGQPFKVALDDPTTLTDCKLNKRLLQLPMLFPIGHIRNINILTWLRGFQDKLLYLVLLYLHPSLFWELTVKRDLKLQF